MRTFVTLHFEDLEPSRFENLVRQLAYDFRQWRILEATGRAGSDDGFVVRGYEIVNFCEPKESNDGETTDKSNVSLADRRWLIQCERERNIAATMLQSHLEAIPAESTSGLYGMIFVACAEFSNEEKEIFRSWCDDRGIAKAHLWGKAELEDQLFKVKNDGLLFAYFGLSLSIRRRLARADLSARLAMKRKAEHTIDSSKTVLLREPEDDCYPYLSEDHPTPRWRVARFLEHHPRGLLLLVKRYFAYLADDKIHWDYLPESERTGLGYFDDPWQEDEDDKKDHEIQNRMSQFWSDLPDQNQANYYVYELIRYEDILDIDENGDKVAPMPHIYLESIKLGQEQRLIENFVRHDPAKVQPYEGNRVEFFPKNFPPASHK